jgi:predicted small metal-binding protein
MCAGCAWKGAVSDQDELLVRVAYIVERHHGLNWIVCGVLGTL